MMPDLKARLIVVPTVAELELKISICLALQQVLQTPTTTQIQHVIRRQLCKYMKAPPPPSRPWASYKPASCAAIAQITGEQIECF